jgi:murein DD-endopeptidase MepM/ murein hydrolase activator NlpD
MVLTALATSIVLGLAAPATAQSQPAAATRATTAPSIAPATLPANASQTAARPNNLPVLGDANDDVVRLQQAMVARGFTLKGGVDGVFSARTQATLRNLQKAVGLKVSGTVDEPTARFLGLIVVARLTPETLPKSGDQGEAVWTVQQALINNGITVKGGADGAFGVATTVALGTFQSRKSLPVTKTLDHATAFALGLVDVAPPAPVAAVAKPAVQKPTTPAVAQPVVAQPVVAQPAVAQPAAATATAITQLDPNALPSRGQRSDAVRLVQQTLINAGVEVKGGADGVFGVATSIALGNFQTSRGLHASQAVDFPTAQALGLIPSLESLGIPQIQVFPVQGRCSFTNTWHEARGSRAHEGVDIIAPRGNLIYAVVDGTITKVYNSASLTGNGVRLTMADGTYFFYAHLDTIAPNITVGTVVKAGQILGTNGSTGNTTTPHLHFEVHPRGGAAIDPTPVVAAVNACHITEPRPQS